MPKPDQGKSFVNLFRDSAPYINAFRGRTFVIVFGGEAVADDQFSSLIHDFVLLNSLGIRLVLVHGTRPQVEARLKKSGISLEYINDMRVTDETALRYVKEAAGAVRVDIEALLSMGLANSPMAGARVRVFSGNVITAKPLGVHGGIDFQHTGEVRRIDAEAIKRQLDQDALVLLSPLGYSPTGEVFNLSAEDVATSTAIALKAEKVLYLTEGADSEIRDSRKKITRELSLEQAQKLLASRRRLSKNMERILKSSINLCLNGINRVHIINRKIDGALLQELFTRDGVGTLINADRYERTRQATIDDVSGILELIKPLEDKDVLVRRSREQLEMEIDHFAIMERDGMVIACAAVHPFHSKNKEQMAELSCLAVHPDYRNVGRGHALLNYIEQHAIEQRMSKLFAFTTKSSHWFIERGFKKADIKTLPMKRKSLYNYKRNSKVFIKPLS